MSGSEEILAKPWPLTGRHEALELACGAIEEGAVAHYLVGDAGTGKTRLAREALRRLEADGWQTAGATASESASGVPLGALAHLVPPDAHGAPTTVFAATAEAIGARTGGEPLVLHVDDAHLLDASSANLLVSLTEAGTVRLIVSARLGSRMPDALVALRRADHVQTTTLGSLDPVAIDTLLHRVLGGPLDGIAESELLRTSGGNPLYLRELVLGAIADGTLRCVAGIWRLEGAFPTSQALGDRVLGRLAQLPEGARAALEIIAVGEPIGLDLLEQMVDPLLLEILEQRSLIAIERDQRRNEVRTAHPVHGEVLRSAMGRIRLRRLSRMHAEAIAATGARRREDAARIVRFQLDAGIAPDIDAVMSGARLARHNQDWATTALLARAGLEAGHADAAALLAEAHFALGEFDEGDEVIARALADEQALSVDAVVALHRTAADSRFFAHDDAAGAVRGLEELAPRIDDPVLSDLLLFSRGAMLIWSARIAEALDLVDGLMEGTDDRVAVQAAMVVETAAATCGPAGHAIDLADRWFGVHVALTDLSGTNNPGFHMIIKTMALANTGRLAEAKELAELGYGASIASQSVVGQLWFALELGRISMLSGDLAGAPRWFREQIAICRSTGWRRPITLGLSGLAMAEAQLGRAAEAAAAIEERRATGYSTIELFAIEGVRGEAWASVAAGDPEAARRLLVAGAEEAEAAGIHLMAAFARLDAVRLGDTGQAAALAATAATADSAIVSLAARWAAAANKADDLLEVAEGFEALGCRMYAAEAFAAAGGAHRRAGSPRSAVAAEQRANELAARCRGAATPALATTDALIPLTAREREIALLVADGLTSKQVAERLYLSARTVSNHLQNVYAKLGIKKRTELSDALKRFGADLEGAS